MKRSTFVAVFAISTDEKAGAHHVGGIGIVRQKRSQRPRWAAIALN